MRTWAQLQRSSTGSAFRCFQGKLQPIDHLLLLLQKLRVGSLDLDLADRFGVFRSTASRCVITWANFLYVILGAQPLWPSRQAVDRFMPEAFRKLFSKTRVVIDCAEIAVQSPSSLVLRSEFYSSCNRVARPTIGRLPCSMREGNPVGERYPTSSLPKNATRN
jgi:hypothetical protein